MLNSIVSNGKDSLRSFALTDRIDFNEQEAKSIYYGIMAIAQKFGFSISDDVRNGVSVENVSAGNKLWFVLRVSYGRIDKAKTFVEDKGLECYVPLQYKEVKKQGKKRIQTLGIS